MSRVSLLLPNRDNERVLDMVIGRLAANTTYPDVELIVVDDGSVDSSPEILRRWRGSGRFPRFELIEKAEGSGVQDSLNLAMASASGEYVVQLDGDASIETPGWVERMLAFFERDERVGVVTAKVVLDNGLVHACGIDATGPEGLCDRSASVEEPIGRRRWHYRVKHHSEGTQPEIEGRAAEVDASIGCCMMLRRDDVEALGGWDTGYSPVWFDDVDLSIGVRSLDRKVFCLPEVRVVHHVTSRNAPTPMTPRRVGGAVMRRVSRRVPYTARDRFETRFDVELTAVGHGREKRERLRQHYAYWRSKWGWDLLNPDVEAIQARWGHTEINWRSDPERLRAGELIARGR
jgi:GT2 family glycosyltransferase